MLLPYLVHPLYCARSLVKPREVLWLIGPLQLGYAMVKSLYPMVRRRRGRRRRRVEECEEVARI